MQKELQHRDSRNAAGTRERLFFASAAARRSFYRCLGLRKIRDLTKLLAVAETKEEISDLATDISHWTQFLLSQCD